MTDIKEQKIGSAGDSNNHNNKKNRYEIATLPSPENLRFTNMVFCASSESEIFCGRRDSYGFAWIRFADYWFPVQSCLGVFAGTLAMSEALRINVENVYNPNWDNLERATHMDLQEIQADPSAILNLHGVIVDLEPSSKLKLKSRIGLDKALQQALHGLIVTSGQVVEVCIGLVSVALRFNDVVFLDPDDVGRTGRITMETEFICRVGAKLMDTSTNDGTDESTNQKKTSRLEEKKEKEQKHYQTSSTNVVADDDLFLHLDPQLLETLSDAQLTNDEKQQLIDFAVMTLDQEKHELKDNESDRAALEQIDLKLSSLAELKRTLYNNNNNNNNVNDDTTNQITRTDTLAVKSFAKDVQDTDFT